MVGTRYASFGSWRAFASSWCNVRSFPITGLPGRYPEPERSKGKQGLVLASFTVTKKGRVTDVRIVNGVAYAPNLAAEARRLLEAMPRWDPATLNGKRVDAEVDVAVPFRLGPVHR